MKSTAQRFHSKTKMAESNRTGMIGPCLEWTGTLDRNGYGQFHSGGAMLYATRWAWANVHGAITNGMYVCHRCDNPACVELSHLFLGTQADNIMDMCAKGRQSRGPRHGELVAKGCKRGDAHYSRLHPERVSRGARKSAQMLGRSAKGSKSGMAKLTEKNVEHMFELRKAGWTQKRIAAELGISAPHVSVILSRKLWTHVVPKP
jgi:hypothetical protein